MVDTEVYKTVRVYQNDTLDPKSWKPFGENYKIFDSGSTDPKKNKNYGFNPIFDFNNPTSPILEGRPFVIGVNISGAPHVLDLRGKEPIIKLKELEKKDYRRRIYVRIKE